MTLIAIAQIIVSIVLIILILLQEKSSGLSGVFGGDGGFYQTKRGLEKIIFIATIILSVAFAGLALMSLLV